MKTRPGIIFTGVICFVGCRAAHDVAVGSYHVVSAPVRFVNRQIDRPPATTASNSDVTTPGHPVDPAPSPSPRHPMVRERISAASPTPTRSSENKTTSAGANSSATAHVQSATPQFPTARPVPDKPGYVYSLSDPGKYVDVTGYAPGSKVKDPYSGKIFLVP